MESILPARSIRPASQDEEEFEQILKIESGSHPHPWTEEGILSELELPHSQFWVMTDDDTDSQIYGYLIFHQLPEHATIVNIAVAEKFRGLGIAKELIRKAVGYLLREGVQRLFLQVRTTNQPAVALYHGLGFDTIKVHKGYYSDGQDAYEMILDLDSTQPNC